MGNGVKGKKMFDEVTIKMCNYYLYIGCSKTFFLVTPTNPSLKISFEIKVMWLQEQPLFLEDTQGLLLKQIRKINTLHFWVGLGGRGHIFLVRNTILKSIYFDGFQHF
jgi:hypothetical protein